jgi:hypothetical protein
LFKKVELSDKKLLDSYYSLGYHMGSESCFANNFAWQHNYNVEYAVIDNFLYIKGGFKDDDPYYLMPYGGGDKKAAVQKLFDILRNAGKRLVLKQLSKENADFLKNEFPGVFTFKKNRNAADYIYKTEDLINLSGKKLHAKRNHINKFLKGYDFIFEELKQDTCGEALAFAVSRLSGGSDSEDEKISLTKLFNNFEALGLKGAVIRIGGKIEAVTLGEMLNKDTAIIHVEKANTDYEGSFAAINQMFAQHCFKDTLYINREEDMGISGLRRAKLSYQPEIILEKYEASEK